MTPLSCPVITLVSVLERRSKARPLPASSSRGTTGSPISASWKTSLRLAISPCSSSAIPSVSPSAGRVRVRAQDSHRAPLPAGTSQLQPVTAWVAQRCQAATGLVRSTRWSGPTSVSATTSRRWWT